jgi:hypothetical protein
MSEGRTCLYCGRSIGILGPECACVLQTYTTFQSLAEAIDPDLIRKMELLFMRVLVRFGSSAHMNIGLAHITFGGPK